MKKSLFCSITAALMFCGYSVCSAKDSMAPKDYKCTEQENKVVYCLDESGRPLTGKWYKYRSDGKYDSIENFKNGYRDGLNTFFDDEGKIQERSYYKKGIKNGMYKRYYSNRTKQMEATYNEGFLDGRVDLYYLNGKLMGRMTYKMGKLQRGYCVDTEGRKTVFGPEQIGRYQNNELYTCGSL